MGRIYLRYIVFSKDNDANLENLDEAIRKVFKDKGVRILEIEARHDKISEEKKE